MERCIFITYIQDNTLNTYINHYCVSYTTPNFRLDQFDLKIFSLYPPPSSGNISLLHSKSIRARKFRRIWDWETAISTGKCVYTRESFRRRHTWKAFVEGRPLVEQIHGITLPMKTPRIYSWWDCQSFQGCRSISITPGRINAGRWKA